MHALSQWWSGPAVHSSLSQFSGNSQKDPAWGNICASHLASTSRPKDGNSTSPSEASSSSSNAGMSSSSQKFVRLDSLEDPDSSVIFGSQKTRMQKSNTEPRSFRYSKFEPQTGQESMGAKFHEQNYTQKEKNWFSSRRHEGKQFRPHPNAPKQGHMRNKVLPDRNQRPPPPPSLQSNARFPDARHYDQGQIRGPLRHDELRQIPHLQIPYNVTKGAYEIWPTIPIRDYQQPSDVMYQVIEGIVPFDVPSSYASLPVEFGNSMVNMMGQMMSSVASLISYPPGNCQPASVPLNPEAPSFVPPSSTIPNRCRNSEELHTRLNPNAEAFYPSTTTGQQDHQYLSENCPPSDNRDTKANGEHSQFSSIPRVEVSSGEKSSPTVLDERESSDCARHLRPHSVLRRKVTPPHSDPPSECSTPVMDEETLKSVADRQSTPWVATDTPAHVEAKPQADGNSTINDSFVSFAEESVNSDVSSCSGSFQEDIKSNGMTRRCPRSISTSSCDSEEDSIIEFSTGSPFQKKGPTPDAVGKPSLVESDRIKSASNGLNKILGVQYESSDEESDEDDYGEDGWDEVDDPQTSNWDDFQECGLMCPMQEKSEKIPEPSESAKCQESCEEDEDERVKEANRKWGYAYPTHASEKENRNCDTAESRPCKVVTFSPEDAWACIFETPEEAADLKAARTSDLKMRQADARRMNDMMKKVFDPEHRSKMFKIIYGKDLRAEG